MRTLALDMDEVLFPFVSAYARWRTGNGLPSFDPGLLKVYDFASVIDAATGTDTDAFIADGSTLLVPPVTGACDALELLSRSWRLVVVTNRYEESQSEGTLGWLDRWLPQVDDVFFARSRRGVSTPGKVALCVEISALWLVDDSDEHLAALKEAGVGCSGALFGCYPWQNRTEHHVQTADWPAVVNLVGHFPLGVG